MHQVCFLPEILKWLSLFNMLTGSSRNLDWSQALFVLIFNESSREHRCQFATILALKTDELPFLTNETRRVKPLDWITKNNIYRLWTSGMLIVEEDIYIENDSRRLTHRYWT